MPMHQNLSAAALAAGIRQLVHTEPATPVLLQGRLSLACLRAVQWQGWHVRRKPPRLSLILSELLFHAGFDATASRVAACTAPDGEPGSAWRPHSSTEPACRLPGAQTWVLAPARRESLCA